MKEQEDNREEEIEREQHYSNLAEKDNDLDDCTYVAPKGEFKPGKDNKNLSDKRHNNDNYVWEYWEDDIKFHIQEAQRKLISLSSKGYCNCEDCLKERTNQIFKEEFGEKLT